MLASQLQYVIQELIKSKGDIIIFGISLTPQQSYIFYEDSNQKMGRWCFEFEGATNGKYIYSVNDI